MNKPKSHRFLRAIARAISIIGILLIVLSLLGFALLMYKTFNTYISDSIAFPVLGILFGISMFGSILYLLASGIVVLCDIANKESALPSLPPTTNPPDHSKYLPKI